MKKKLAHFSIYFLACAALSLKAAMAEANLPPKKQILFVCTGNFYRSRIAEALFNQKVRDAHLDWQAVSRGLKLVTWQHGISPFAQRELAKRGVPPELWKGAPKPLTQEDLEKSDCIILMDEIEHRPLLEKKFPLRDGRKIQYWHIGDIGKMKAASACQAIARNIDGLLGTLGR